MIKWKKIHEKMLRTVPRNRKYLILINDVDKMIPKFYIIPPIRDREKGKRPQSGS